VALATRVLHDPVRGMSPSSTADESGGYGAVGVEGQAHASGSPLAWRTTCASEATVSPHPSAIALPVTPQAAYENLVRLRSLYPGIYTHGGGFYDAVDPSTGSVGHRRLVLDQPMIVAALDDALNHRALQRYFAAGAESWAARVYLARSGCRSGSRAAPPAGATGGRIGTAWVQPARRSGPALGRPGCSSSPPARGRRSFAVRSGQPDAHQRAIV
jgi:hypothetical protein